MSEINFRISIKEENVHLFKRCIRKLLESTFILRDKDEKLYQFASRESNRQDISEYLRMIGFDVILEEKTGVCMLIASEEDADTVCLLYTSPVYRSGKRQNSERKAGDHDGPS